MGLVFLLFGILKFFPDVSPAEELTIKTTDALSFDLIPGHIAIVLIASLECIIGLLLITGRFLRTAVYLLAGQLVGILAPLPWRSSSRRGVPRAGSLRIVDSAEVRDAAVVGSELLVSHPLKVSRHFTDCEVSRVVQ